MLKNCFPQHWKKTVAVCLLVVQYPKIKVKYEIYIWLYLPLFHVGKSCDVDEFRHASHALSQATWLHACMVPSCHLMSIYRAILGCQHHGMSYQFCQSIDCCTCLVFMAWNVTLSSHSWLHIQRVFFLWHGHMFFHHSIILCDSLFPILII